MKTVVAIALVGISSGAAAEPVNLECATAGTEKTTNYRIVLDEGGQTAAFVDDGFSRGQIQSVRALFTQTDVSFEWLEPLLRITIEFRIDRATLRFTRGLKDVPGTTESGSCKLAELPRRQF